MTLQEELNAIQARLEAHGATLEETLAAITATYAKHEAKAEANRQAVLLKQQQHLDQLEADRLYRARCWLPYQKIIDEAKAQKELNQ
jgi:crotonobetainyl-CoA:carnitine CoA-transferase CaiB-like acyl-CoA transferase